MKQQIVSREHFRAMTRKEAINFFASVNKNPDNEYRTGFEFYMNFIPVIHGANDRYKQEKLDYIADIFSEMSERLLQESWVHENWPSHDKMLNRVVLAIDENGGEIVLVRWNTKATPIHGHQYGQMIDYLMKGKAKEIEYELTSIQHRHVQEVGYHEMISGNVLSNDYHEAETPASRGALIHKFIPLTKCITLHYIPEHPRDGRGNLFNEPKS